jgi:hypothetical protein
MSDEGFATIEAIKNHQKIAVHAVSKQRNQGKQI